MARGDLLWPEHPESASNQQYMFLDDILVAPIWESKENVTSRSVWVPPGDWEDAWEGSVATGPKRITVSQPYERLPMWHRCDGGFLVVADEPALRVEAQDWSSLTLELFPAAAARTTLREVFERGSAERTGLALHTDGSGGVRVEIDATGDGRERAWTLRVHLRPGQRATGARVDGVAVGGVRHLPPGAGTTHFPLGGAGTPAAPKAGPIAEVRLLKGSSARRAELKIASDVMWV